MTHKQIEKYRKQLVEILKGPDKTARLEELAHEVGASTCPRQTGGISKEAELAESIHFALQTASMIDMCNTASRNYWIAFVAALVAMASAIAAWTAVYIGVLEKIGRLNF